MINSRANRFFCYNEWTEFNPDNSAVIIKSVEDIRREYWPYWYDRMCEKFGKELVDSKYTFEDCLNDWIVVNWAWELKNE